MNINFNLALDNIKCPARDCNFLIRTWSLKQILHKEHYKNTLKKIISYKNYKNKIVIYCLIDDKIIENKKKMIELKCNHYMCKTCYDNLTKDFDS